MIGRFIMRWFRAKCVRLAENIEAEHCHGPYPPGSVGAEWLSLAAKLRAF